MASVIVRCFGRCKKEMPESEAVFADKNGNLSYLGYPWCVDCLPEQDEEGKSYSDRANRIERRNSKRKS